MIQGGDVQRFVARFLCCYLSQQLPYQKLMKLQALTYEEQNIQTDLILFTLKI